MANVINIKDRAELSVAESEAIQERPNEDMSFANNCIVRTRSQVFEAGIAIMTDYRLLERADDVIKRDYLSQLESLVKSSLIILGRHVGDDDKSDVFALCLELLSNNKSEGACMNESATTDI